MDARYYVYVIRDQRPGQRNAPIYVGKGRKRRAEHKLGDPQRVRNEMLRAILTHCKESNCPAQIEKIFCRSEASAWRFFPISCRSLSS